jgi:hypothetical protein
MEFTRKRCWFVPRKQNYVLRALYGSLTKNYRLLFGVLDSAFSPILMTLYLFMEPIVRGRATASLKTYHIGVCKFMFQMNSLLDLSRLQHCVIGLFREATNHSYVSRVYIYQTHSPLR